MKRQKELCDPVAAAGKASETSRLTLPPSTETIQNLGVGIPNVPGPMVPIVVGCVDYFVGPNEHHQTRFIYQVHLLHKGQQMPSRVDLSKIVPTDTIGIDKYFFGGWDAD